MRHSFVGVPFIHENARWWSGLLLGVALFLMPACSQQSDPMATASGPVNLASAFRGLMESRASDAFLVVTVRATGDFVQFTPGAGAVQLDFPLVTPRQRQLQPRLEEVCAEIGLTRTVNSGTDGSRFLDYDIAGSPEEIAETVRVLLRRVFAVDSDAQLSLAANGFSLNGA